ncbi:hypothetical protein BOX15_Mlig003669g3, partial [Macrostomum lignano]
APSNMAVKKIRRSKSDRAGLVFPVAKVRRFLRAYRGFSRMRISEGASVYAAAIMEYLAAELLELSGNACKALKAKRLIPRHLMLAIQNDAELEKLLRHVTIPQAGVVPNIWAPLLPQKAAAPAKSAAASSKTAALKVGAKRSGGATTARKRAPAAAAAAAVTVAAPAAAAAKRRRPGPAAAAAATTAPVRAKAAPTPPAARPKLNVAILSEKQLQSGQKLTVLKGDITTVQADAIVHPTSSGYPTGGQVGNAIVRRGGAAMKQSIQALSAASPLASCAAKACPAHGLGADWVINCNGPSWNVGNAANLIDDLEKTVKNCLAVAETAGWKSVALPSIGSGRWDSGGVGVLPDPQAEYKIPRQSTRSPGRVLDPQAECKIPRQSTKSLGSRAATQNNPKSPPACILQRRLPKADGSADNLADNSRLLQRPDELLNQAGVLRAVRSGVD